MFKLTTPGVVIFGYSEQATIIVCQATPLMDPLEFSGLSGVEGFAEWYMEG